MNAKAKTVLSVVAFAVFIGLAVFAYNTLSKNVTPRNLIEIAPSQNSSISSGQATSNQSEEKIKAPDFTVLDSKGNSVKLSDMLGKPVVVNFWASWCPPCKSEMPEFNEVYQELGEEVAFMMVDLVDGQRETQEKGAQYIQEQDFSFPVYFDMQQEAADAYGITAIPTTLFIDKEGYLVTGVQSAIDAKTLRKGIDLIR